ncbi:MAG TPA: heme exporter protein CcmB [Bryobacteraceae bacterium]|nr:heme exporter protein CcmB [Bryobacteraceae bacterium]
MKLFLTQTLTIAAKDLRAEWRTKEALNASIAFSLVMLVLFSFAVDPESMPEFSGGLLWLVFSFAGALVLNRSFARETQNDCLDALVASPVPSAALFTGKALANFAMLLAVESVCLPAFGFLFNISWATYFWSLVGVVLLGTWGLTVVGTMFSALTVNLRLRELMLPTLVYPVMIPALMAAMELTRDLLNATPLGGDNLIWVRLLAGFDIIFTALSVALVDTVLVG